MFKNNNNDDFWQDFTQPNAFSEGVNSEQMSTDGQDFERIAAAMYEFGGSATPEGKYFNWPEEDVDEDEVAPRRTKSPELWDEVVPIAALDQNMPIGAIGEESLMSGLVLTPEEMGPEHQNAERDE